MAAKRADETQVFDSSDHTPVLSAALRAAESRPVTVEKNPDDKIGLFWRVFGGTILSIVALVAITLFNNLHNTISELRGELNKLQERVPDLVKKDEFNSRHTSLYDRVQGLQTQNNLQNATLTSLKTEVDGHKDRLSRQTTESDVARKELALGMEALKKDVAGVELLKERVTAVEAVKKELAALDALKEKMVGLCGDLKSHRDEYMKLRQDVDRNQVGDQERKARRDEQYKDIEKAFKDLQLAIQDCQVKVARLEGQTNPMKTSPKPAGPDTKAKGTADGEE